MNTLKDDRLQGILFNQSHIVDLTPHTYQEKFIKLATTKKELLVKWGMDRQKQLRYKIAKHPENHFVFTGRYLPHTKQVAKLAERLKINY